MTLQNIYLHHRCCLQLDKAAKRSHNSQSEERRVNEWVDSKWIWGGKQVRQQKEKWSWGKESAEKREIAMQTFQVIYYMLSEYYGFAVLDSSLIFHSNIVYVYEASHEYQGWQLFLLFDIYRCIDSTFFLHNLSFYRFFFCSPEP